MVIDIPFITWEYEYIFRILSLWPNTYNIPAAILLWTSWITTMPFLLIYITQILDDAVELMPSVCDFSDMVAMFIKLALAWMNRKILMSLIIEMNEDWKELEIKVTRETRLSCLVLRLDLYVYVGAIMMCFPRLIFIYITDIPENRAFFLKTTYPFDEYKTPYYETIVIIHSVQTTLMSIADLMPPAFLVALVGHSGVQSDILQQQLTAFVMMAKNGIATDANIVLMVEDVIKRHQKIIDFSEKTEKVFSLISLIHCLCSAIAIGCGGLIFIIIRDPLDILRFALYYAMRLFQTFILCYAGQHLSDKGMAIAEVIFESDWFDINSKYVKILHVMILRAQKPLQITTGKFSPLSIEIFAVILKTAGSYLSVLRATYDN